MPGFVNLVIDGIDELVGKFRKCKDDSERKDTGVGYHVGYADPIAIFVHENLNAFHPQGQAKFLEQPTIEMHHELAVSIQRSMEQDLGLDIATKDAAILLLQASQELVPTDTEALKYSGYVRTEHGDTVYGSSDTPEEIAAWRQLLKNDKKLQDLLQQNFKTG